MTERPFGQCFFFLLHCHKTCFTETSVQRILVQISYNEIGNIIPSIHSCCRILMGLKLRAWANYVHKVHIQFWPYCCILHSRAHWTHRLQDLLYNKIIELYGRLPDAIDAKQLCTKRTVHYYYFFLRN